MSSMTGSSGSAGAPLSRRLRAHDRGRRQPAHFVPEWHPTAGHQSATGGQECLALFSAPRMRTAVDACLAQENSTTAAATAESESFLRNIRAMRKDSAMAGSATGARQRPWPARYHCPPLKLGQTPSRTTAAERFPERNSGLPMPACHGVRRPAGSAGPFGDLVNTPSPSDGRSSGRAAGQA